MFNNIQGKAIFKRGNGRIGGIIFPLLKIFKRGNIPYSPF
jgi:hypothetical protein